MNEMIVPTVFAMATLLATLTAAIIRLQAVFSASERAREQRDRELFEAIRRLERPGVDPELIVALSRLERLVEGAAGVGERVARLEQAVPLVVRVAPADADARCPYCHDDIEADDTVVRCDRCQARQHLECVNAHGDCSVFGCGRAVSRERAAQRVGVA